MLPLLLILLGVGQLTSLNHFKWGKLQHRRAARHSIYGKDSETSQLQITVPRKLETNNNDADVSEMHVTYAIQINRKTYTLFLEKQSFVDPHFLIYSYNRSGTVYPDSSFIKGHCFYQGYAMETPKSAVTLSICSGLRGLLQLENVSYGIEPLESAATYEHMLYQIKNNKADFPPLQESYPMIQLGDQPYKILVKSQTKPDVEQLRKTLKIQIIMDKALYEYMGSEVAVAAEKVVYIIGVINTMFSQLKVTIMLTYLELWSDQNKILSSGDANEILQRFVSWKKNFLSHRSHDLAFLLIYRDYPNYVGATYHGMACDAKLGAGIALYPKKITLEAFSVVMAQLLGISLGLTYDDNYNCFCPGTACIMNPQAIRSHGVKYFSNCSMDGYNRVVSQPEFKCLQNQTVSNMARQSSDTCGNGRVDNEEQCDCGTPEQCTFKRCCNPTSCTLIGAAECGSGACCDNKTCVFHERGHICRISKDPCDFSEYCSGTNEFCVADLKSADLEPCNNKTAFCYKGICRDTTRQCVQLFGKFAKGADYLCTQEVNYQADKFGDCDGKRCLLWSVLCGKLVCHWTHTRILPITDFDVQYTYIGGHVCISAAGRPNSAPRDKTYIGDGTICDENKACFRGSCQPISANKNYTTCNSTRHCNGHGVCNDEDVCHCDPGYAPPHCKATPSSPGGSLYDGFWYWDSKKKAAVMPTKKLHVASGKNGLLISFCIFLTFLLLIAIIALKWNKIKFWKRETVNEGSD
uniref:ADAM metallopeptidase domain 18 n=1 Tax=Molossus molossus TaxID=27622 RepID=A0A7J8GK35_MOLMO|nr:hypothetical protein HJG59_000304 [Molossus molossus]